MRMTAEDFTAPDVAAFGHDLSPEADPRGRASHVLLLNARREVLLRRLDLPGVPHGGRWTSGVVAPLQEGESYAMAATRALRETLGLRLPGLRFVDRAWVDDEGGRSFLAVFAAIHDGPLPPGPFAFVPLDAVARAVRRGDPDFEPAFARAFRVLEGDADE